MLALHDEQLKIHGGPEGLGDGGDFESALARPQNLLACGEPGLPDLAAAYAFGLACAITVSSTAKSASPSLPV
ncbi:MAG: hypothetical protein ACRYGP_22420 [Janthinobacterium lividum]